MSSAWPTPNWNVQIAWHGGVITMSGKVPAHNKETAIVRFCESASIDAAMFNRASHVSAFEISNFPIEEARGEDE